MKQTRNQREIAVYNKKPGNAGLFLPETQFDEICLRLFEGKKNVVLQALRRRKNLLWPKRLALHLSGQNDPPAG